MPRIKPKTCHKCGQMYVGWRCPRCYRKSSGAARSARASRATGGRRLRRLGMSVNSGLMPAPARTSAGTGARVQVSVAPSAAATPPDVNRYDDPRICIHCGFFTTTHPCTYCRQD